MRACRAEVGGGDTSLLRYGFRYGGKVDEISVLHCTDREV
jgi:hypothetical protein